MCSGGVVTKPQGEPGAKPAHNVYFLRSRVIGWELMSCAFGAWCPKPQGEPGTKPAHNVHVSYSCVIGLEPMSGALGIWCRNHKRKWRKNQLRLFIVPFTCHWLGVSSGQVLWGPGDKPQGEQNRSCQGLRGPGVETAM